MKTCLLVSFAVWLVVGFIVSPLYPSEKTNIPEKAYTVDPKERYMVEWERVDFEKKQYALFLKHIRTGEKHEIMRFLEKTELLWSPDGTYFSVAEWNGAFFSDIFIYSTDSLDDPIDMQEVMASSFKNIPYIRENEIVVFEMVKWVDKDRFIFKIYGSGKNDPGGFEKFFEYKIKGRAKEIKK